MKKIIIILLFLTNSSFIFSQKIENKIEVVKQLEINKASKNSSFFFLEDKDSKLTLTSSEVVGIPLSTKSNIKIIISEQLYQNLSKIEIADSNNTIFNISDYENVVSSKFEWKEIKFYDNSNNLIGVVTFDLFF